MSDKKENKAQQNKDSSQEQPVQDQNHQEEKTPGQIIKEDIAVAEKTEEQQSAEQKEKETSETVDDLKAQISAEKERYLRLMAEFDNYKKRISRDYDRLVESANEKIVIDLVDVRENFDRAVRSGEKSDAQSLFEGLKLIYNKFETVLEKNGLEVFAAIGDPFDPQIHDALMKTPHPSIPEDHVADVYEKGYRLKGKVIKHAKVIVSSGNPES